MRSLILCLKLYTTRILEIIISINSSNKLEALGKETGFRVIRARLGKKFLELKKFGGVFATEPSKVVDPN